MGRKYLAFDLEIAKEIPGGELDWNIHHPLGISCAATLASDFEKPMLWYGQSGDNRPTDQMSQRDAMNLIQYIATMKRDGYTIVTWNGLGFDFDVLSEESGMYEECKRQSLDQVDMMFHVFCELGYPVALEWATKGMGLAGKSEGMNGAIVPGLWAQGHRQAVLDYVAQDVRITMNLVQTCEQRGSLSWIARSGNLRSLILPSGWLTVREAMKLPDPDTSWMSDPWPRSKFTAWLT